MKREDAVRMAREAGFNQPWTAPKETQERLTRFATLAAEWGAKQEREALDKSLTDEQIKQIAAPEKRHPGYILGLHWLETAYSRICAGEAEANVLRDYGLMREEAFLTGVAHLKAEIERLKAALPYDWNQLEACRASLREHMAEIKRLKADNERLRDEVRVLRLYGNKDCTAMADEAMKKAALRRDASTAPAAAVVDASTTPSTEVPLACPYPSCLDAEGRCDKLMTCKCSGPRATEPQGDKT